MNQIRKVIISDFDDTLYHKGIISNRDIKSIDKFRKNGNLFVIATGSSYTSFLSKIKDFDLKYDYLIVNHGSTILKNDDIIFSVELDINVLNNIIKRYNLNNENNYALKNPYGNFFSTASKGLVSPDTLGITKIHLEFNRENLKKELDYLKQNYGRKINIYDVKNSNIEIISSKASKLIAIEKILIKEKINISDVYAIGDGNSDIEMIKKYNGYAMENSVAELKKYCVKKVNGISQLIEKLL